MRRRPPARAAGDRGAVLVEFAFVLPILVMFLFGTLTAALSWDRSMSISNAARQGARFGATLPTSNYATLDLWLTDVSSRTVANSSGDLAVNVPGRQVCVAYVHPAGTGALDQTRSRTEAANGTVTYGSSPCYSDGQATSETRVQVDVQRNTTLDAGIWQKVLLLREQVTFRYEVGG